MTLLDNEFDFNGFEVPIHIGVSGVVLNLLTNVLGRNAKETQFEREFNYNYLQGFNRKHEKWLQILENDLLNKATYDQQQVKKILSSSFVDLYFNKYLKKLYYFYFVMGYARDTKMEQEVVIELKQPIDNTFLELFQLAKKNTLDGEQGNIYGPLSVDFAKDAYADGMSYSVYRTLESWKK